jgi:hypothetical protein
VLALLLVFLFFPKPAPTFYLENNYWSTQGVFSAPAFILNKGLYRFVSMPLSDLLTFHLSVLKEIKYGWFLLGLPITSFMGLFVGVFYSRTKSVEGTLYAIALISVSFFLTLDYGRYFYVFFMFALLASSNSVKLYFTTFPKLPFIRLDHATKLFEKIALYRMYFLLTLIIAPSGFWAEKFTVHPRIFTFLHELIFL